MIIDTVEYFSSPKFCQCNAHRYHSKHSSLSSHTALSLADSLCIDSRGNYTIKSVEEFLKPDVVEKWLL